MAERFERFTEAMRRALPYVESAFSRGIAPTRALEEYRAGGGAIRTQDWFRLYNAFREAAPLWEIAQRMGEEFVPSERYFQPRDVRYQKQYVYAFRYVPIYEDIVEGQRVEIRGDPDWRFVQFDQPVSRGEAWRAFLEERTKYRERGVSPPAVRFERLEERYYRRAP
jgi:hypothetical protein